MITLIRFSFVKHCATKQHYYITLWSDICLSKEVIGQHCKETAEEKKEKESKKTS
jgi:hypothetical protein